MTMLGGFRVLEIGPGRAAAVAGLALTNLGAEVEALSADVSTPLARYLIHGKEDGGTAAEETVLAAALRRADLVICEGAPDELMARGLALMTLRTLNPKAAFVLISPFGQTGPMANMPASDLTLFLCERHRIYADGPGG